jgi:ATP-dependent Clp protease ATP-binding subunit ClpB
LEVSDDAKRLVAQLGYDPAFGARPIKRAIQHHIADRLAMLILEGKYAEGDIVHVDAHDGELTFG